MNLSICICMQIKIALLRNICEVIHDRHAVQQKQDCVLPSHWSVCHEYSLCRTLGAVYRLRHHYYSLDDTANILSFHILSYNLLFLNLWKGGGGLLPSAISGGIDFINSVPHPSCILCPLPYKNFCICSE